MAESAAAQHCPECGSSKLFRAGLRYLADGGSVQRWLCRSCGYRFSGGHNNSNRVFRENRNCQILRLEAKNLDSATETKTVAGEGIDQTQQGLIVEFQWKMKKRQLAETTIKSRTYDLTKLLKYGADLLKPETVETILATEEMTIPQKFNMVKTYKAFTKAFNIDWEPVKIRYKAKEPFYPLEEEIDLLINSCSKTTAAFLQVAKDTGARISEIRRIQWTDINEKNQTIAINHPAKGSRTRTIKVSEKTLWMLKQLKKNHGEYVFNPTFVSQRKIFNRTRKKLAEKTQNPRLLQIHFHTLRHWRASMEYEKTGDIYAVKNLLGHVSISNTDRYQHGNFSSDEYIVKRPRTSQEEDALITAGFEFVRFDSGENVPIYRKRK
ncbi:MAG: site-specific integrase [Candidatus Bathyarchaeota archaeon]|nr:site-specific integrase [Candidatus Bathyarchaeota archaeon]